MAYCAQSHVHAFYTLHRVNCSSCTCWLSCTHGDVQPLQGHRKATSRSATTVPPVPTRSALDEAKNMALNMRQRWVGRSVLLLAGGQAARAASALGGRRRSQNADRTAQQSPNQTQQSHTNSLIIHTVLLHSFQSQESHNPQRSRGKVWFTCHHRLWRASREMPLAEISATWHHAVLARSRRWHAWRASHHLSCGELGAAGCCYPPQRWG